MPTHTMAAAKAKMSTAAVVRSTKPVWVRHPTTKPAARISAVASTMPLSSAME